MITAGILAALPNTAASEVLFSNNFNDDPTGTYTWENYINDWGAHWGKGVKEGRISIVEEPEALEGKSMRTVIPAGFGGKAMQWLTTVPGNPSEVYMSYDFKFDKGFDWSPKKGGKLPNFVGPKDSGDGQTAYKNRWRVGPLWNPGRTMHTYVYDADTAAYPLWWDGITLTDGRWYHYVTRIKINSPNNNDGIIQTWLDGKLVASKYNVRFYRDRDGLSKKLFWELHGDNVAVSDEDRVFFFDNVMISDTFPDSKQTAPSAPSDVRLSVE
jgi:hypothetical protein